MKRFLFFCCLAITTVTGSFAQSATTQATSEKALFSSRINEMDASLANNKPAKAQSIFAEIKTNMITHLSNSKTALAATPPANKAAAMESYNKEQKLFLQINDLSKDLAGNRTELHTKLTEYYSTY